MLQSESHKSPQHHDELTVGWKSDHHLKVESVLSPTMLEDSQSKLANQPQNITLQVNGEEEEKFFLNRQSTAGQDALCNNSLKINHDNGLSRSCLSLNQFDLPSSAQLSLDSLSSDNCIHAEAGRLFHQQLDKELSKVIPSAQRRKTSVESVQSRYKQNSRKKKKNSLTSMQNPIKQFDELDAFQANLNCPSIYEPLISNSNGHHLKSQLPTDPYGAPGAYGRQNCANLLDPNRAAASKLTKDSHSVQSIFSTQQPANLLKPPCSRATTASIGNLESKTGTPNLSTGTTNRLNLIDASNSNLKADLSPTNLRRRCIAKNGVANIRNAKISRKSQRFFLDFFNTMIDIEWHYNLLAFTLSFVISWLFFAVIWWSIAYQHGDLYKIEELGEVSVDLDKMNNMNLNFLTENIDNLNNPLNTANVLSKSKRSIVGGFEDQDKILNKLAYSILNNRTTIQQLIEHFNLSKLKLNSTSGTNIYHKMEDGTNLTHFLSYAKNNEKLKETFASHNISLNKIAKLVQPKRLQQQQLNDSSHRSAEQNDIKLLNNGDQSFTPSANLEAAQQQLDQSLIMNTVTTNEEHLPPLPIANLTLDQRHQLENLFYLMQLQYLLQQERNKQQIAKFLTKLAKKAHNINMMNKPSHPPETPPAHPLPSITAIEEEQQIEREQEAKHKEQERKAEQQRQQMLEKQKQQQSATNETNGQTGNQSPEQPDNSLPNLPNLSDLPSSDAVIEEAVEKASEIVIPGCGLNGTKACRRVCLDNINSFADALLFSIETQHTIGYGSRHPRGDCKIVLLVLMVQSIFGCLIQCFVVGFVFAKLSRPQNRHQTLVFSKRAVINLGEYDQTYDFVGDAHNNDNQFNLNFEELHDLVCLMKSGEMQEMIGDCGCTATNSETGSDQNRRHSSDAISTDDLLQPSSLQGSCLNSFNPLKEQNLLNNFLNIPSSKRCSNVSFLNSGLSTLQSKVSNLNQLNLRCETEHNVDYTGNKNYRLEFRLGDIRERSHIINARISAYFLSKENYYFKNELLPKSGGKFAKYQLFKKRRSEVDYSNLRLNSNLYTAKAYNYNEMIMEKKLHNFTQKKLALKIDNVEHSDGELPLVLWPIVVSHEINDRSPLYNIGREEITNSKFEIVIVLEGTIESTGQSVQARTSYLPSEILWGEKFLPVLQSDNEDAEFLVNFSMFNMTKKQKSMPNFSSREYQIRKKFHKLCMLKKYLAKLSDAEGAAELDGEQSGAPESAANNHLSNLNLLRHLLNQNDTQHNLNGLINNIDDLNNLKNLLNTLNKLVSNGSGTSSNSCSANGASLFNSKDLSCGSFNGQSNKLNATSNLNHANSSAGQFYQQSLSVDQAALNRKKSTDISNLLDLLQHSNVGPTKPEHCKSKSINFLNTALNGDHLASQHSSHSVNNQCISGQCMNDQTNGQANRVTHLNQLNSQMNDQMRGGGVAKKLFNRNDSEHIQIEEDFLRAHEATTPERKRPAGLKLLSLFQPSPLDSQLVGYDNHNYNANYQHSKNDPPAGRTESSNENELSISLNKLDKASAGRANQQATPSQAKSQTNLYVKSDQALRKLKDPKSNFKSSTPPPRPSSRFTVKSESMLNFNPHPNYGLSNSKHSPAHSEHTQSSHNLINSYLHENLEQLKASRSEWNICANIRSVAKKRQFFRPKK